MIGLPGLHQTVRHDRGLSMLEIMFTISLLTVMLVTFAAVYPIGFKLNRRSAKTTVAIQTATAVAAEIQEMPFTDSRGGLQTVTLDTLVGMADAPTRASFVAERMKTKVPKGFTIRPEGIFVKNLPTTFSGPSGATPYFSEIQVTCYWTDNPAVGEREMTVKVAKSENHISR